MTVAELIEKLKDENPDELVAIEVCYVDDWSNFPVLEVRKGVAMTLSGVPHTPRNVVKLVADQLAMRW